MSLLTEATIYTPLDKPPIAEYNAISQNLAPTSHSEPWHVDITPYPQTTSVWDMTSRNLSTPLTSNGSFPCPATYPATMNPALPQQEFSGLPQHPEHPDESENLRHTLVVVQQELEKQSARIMELEKLVTQLQGRDLRQLTEIGNLETEVENLRIENRNLRRAPVEGSMYTGSQPR